MKKIMFMIFALVAIANAGFWSTAQGMLMKEKKPDASYSIDTAGMNPRIYEFTTEDKKMKCVVIFTSVQGGSDSSLQCIKIGGKDE